MAPHPVKFHTWSALIAFLFLLHVQGAPASAEPAKEEAVDVTELLTKIRDIPFNEADKIDDAAYHEILKLGEKAIPSLIENITNTTKTPDPRFRLMPVYEGWTVGDNATSMLSDITGGGWDGVMPPELREEVKHFGVKAYLRYVKKPEHRKVIQERWRIWVAGWKAGKAAAAGLSAPFWNSPPRLMRQSKTAPTSVALHFADAK